MKRLLTLLAVAFTLTAFAGRSGVAPVLIENVSMATTSLDGAKRAIVSAATGRKWIPQVVAPGQIVCTINVRGKHEVVVEVAYTASTFSIRYKSSENMNYDPATQTISPKYNQWVNNLAKDIQIFAAKQALEAPAGAVEATGANAAN